MLRSILAVLVGYTVMAVGQMVLLAAWFRTPDQVPTDQVPTVEFLVLVNICGFVAAAVGGYVAAVIARRAEMKHVLALAALTGVMAIVGLLIAGRRGPLRGPLWLHLASPVFMILCIFIGGWWRSKRTAGR